MRINFVTTNAGKLKEVQQYIQQHRSEIEIVQASIDLEEIQSREQQEVAMRKAQQAFAQLQKPVLIDDSGVYFDRYDKFPGTLTKFVYQGIGLEGLRRLYTPGDRAHMKTIFVYYAGEHDWYMATDTTYGTLVTPQEYLDFVSLPYNRFFIPDGADCTYAELDRQGRKQEFNHRTNALRDLLAQLVNTKHLKC